MTAGVDPQRLAARLIDVCLRQLLIDGFIHADPHPGNLLVCPDGTLIFLDFGMLGIITDADRRSFSALARVLMTRDLDSALQSLADLGVLRSGANPDPLKRALSFLVDRLTGIELRPGRDFDALLTEFRDWLQEEPLQFPGWFLYIARALGLLVGLCSGLDPTIDWSQVVKERALPLLEQARRDETAAEGGSGSDWRRLVGDLFGLNAAAVVDGLWGQVKSLGLSLITGQLERSMANLATGAVRRSQARRGLQG